MTEIETQETRFLRKYLARKIRARLRRFHLNRDVVIGFIGDRGDGKSLSAADIALRDYMLSGEPCWSNMKIKCTVVITDEEMEPFGMRGGSVVCEAEDIDIDRFLKCDGYYSGGVIVLDEINMEFAESRRSQSNVNLYFNRVGQQLRKDQSALIFTVIDEMWVDPRLRDISDIFIKCQDSALRPHNLIRKQRQGIRTEWNIYPWSRKLCGLNYKELGRFFGPIPLNTEHLWGIIDTYQKQAEGQVQYSRKIGVGKSQMEITKSNATVAEVDKWGWLYDKIQELKALEYTVVPVSEMWEYLSDHDVPKVELGKQLSKMGVSVKGDNKYRRYIIPDFTIKEPETKKKLVISAVA